MKKIFKLNFILMFVFCFIFLVGCVGPTGGNSTDDCKHQYDNACDATCNLCGEEREDVHVWADATYTAPKTCTLCGATEGTPLVCTHEYDNECDEECNICHQANPDAHDWVEATLTEAKYCTICKQVVGLPIYLQNLKFENTDFNYDGTEKELLIEGELPEGYTVQYENNKGTEVGTYYAAATIYDENGEVDAELRVIMTIDCFVENEEFEAFLDEMFVVLIEGDQISSNIFVSNPENFGLEHYEAVWYTYETFDVELAIADFEMILDELYQFELGTLTRSQRTGYDIIEDLCLYHIEYYENNYNQMATNYIDCFGGMPADFPTYITGYTFRNEQDVKDVISFIKTVKDAFPTYVEYAQDRIDNGRPLSDYTIDEMNKYLQGVVDEGEDYFLNDYLANKFAELDFLTDEQKEAYTAEAQTALKGDFIQAHADLIVGLKALKGNCTEEGYLSAYGEEGKAYYKLLLEDKLGYTDLDMEAYGAYLQESLDTYSKKINTVMSMAQRLGTSGYNNFVNFATGSRAMINGTPDELMVFLKEFAKTIVPELKTNPEITISYMDPTQGESSNAVAYYMSSAVDSFDQEFITLNGSNLSDTTNTLLTLAHEGYPGHLYNYVYTKEAGLHPINLLMRNLTYGEGWATYVELELLEYLKASTEIKAKQYACDYFIYNNLLSYMAYARADFGIHYEGWAADDVYDLFQSIGFNVDYATALDLLRNLIEMPAQYHAYGYGMSKFYDLHNDVEAALGDYYDQVDFNAYIQTYGWVPMEMLEELVAEYIVAQKHINGIE